MSCFSKQNRSDIYCNWYKAALYAAAEYRFIPQFNPMANQNWNPFSIDWFQLVLYAELGRVAENYNTE
ncbi:hypothetical protein N8878_05400 [Psychromonas sp.]|nr:hypothetical protein [Psychromonas sp.]